MSKMTGAGVPQDLKQRALRKVTYQGALVNVVLALVKLVVGSMINSLALLADGIHSLSDLGTDLVTIMGVSLAEKPHDRSHPYGHGRLETLGALVVAVVLVGIGVGIIWQAARALRLGLPRHPGVWVLVIAGVSVAAKEGLYQVTRRVSIRHQSSLLYANAWHHRSDALSSVAVLIGGGAALRGFGYGDQIAGLLVGLMVILVAVKIALGALFELSEGAADRQTISAVEEVLDQHPGVRGWHLLRSRKVGSEIFMDVHVLVKPTLTVAEGHRITRSVEGAVARALTKPVNILVHMEPDIAEERSAAEASGAAL